MTYPTIHAGSSADDGRIRAEADGDDAGSSHDADHANHKDASENSALERRVADLEAQNEKKEEQLKAMAAQVQERMTLPRGQQPSSCCQCDGVVTYAPHGHCSCPYGAAESRAAPAGCQASMEASYKGMKACASACQEVFTGKAGSRERAAALNSKVRMSSEKDLQHGQDQKHAQARDHTAVKHQHDGQERDRAAKPEATGSEHHGQAKALEGNASRDEHHEQGTSPTDRPVAAAAKLGLSAAGMPARQIALPSRRL